MAAGGERSCGSDQPPLACPPRQHRPHGGDCHQSSLKTEERNDVRVRAIAPTFGGCGRYEVFAPVIFEFLKFGLPKTMDKKSKCQQVEASQAEAGSPIDRVDDQRSQG